MRMFRSHLSTCKVAAMCASLSLGWARTVTATRVFLSLCQSDSCVCMSVTRVGARSDSDTCKDR